MAAPSLRTWSHRYVVNVGRLKSGERAAIMQVVAELRPRVVDGSLGPGERRMLLRAEELLQGPPGGGAAGVREPRRPMNPSGSGGAR